MKQISSLTIVFLILFTPYHEVSGVPKPTRAPLSTTPTPTPTPTFHNVSSTPFSSSVETTSNTPTTSPWKTTPPPPPPIVEVAEVIYRGSTIRIFADRGAKNLSRFFYDPLVQLDPKSITVHPHIGFNQCFVSFNITMWNPELRRQVFDRVKSLNGQPFNVTKIEEKDIHVLPFVDIQLYSDKSVKVTYSSQSYDEANENLKFEIYCISRVAANLLADNLDSGFVMYNWNMTCRGLNLGNQLRKEIVYTYPISNPNSTPTAPTTTAKAPTTITTAPIPTPPSPPIVEVSKVSYRGSIIRIFADAGVKNPNRFFFEPLVQLNPKSIIAHPHGLLKWDVVSFTIEMWNSELRRQVLARVKSLKSLPNVTVEEQDVYVLPFETIQLTHGVFTTINSSVEVGMMNTSKSYLRQSESLQFYLTFNSTVSANGIAENFRLNPGFVLELWNMTLMGHGLDLGNQLEKKQVYRYPIATSSLTSCSQQ